MRIALYDSGNSCHLLWKLLSGYMLSKMLRIYKTIVSTDVPWHVSQKNIQYNSLKTKCQENIWTYDTWSEQFIISQKAALLSHTSHNLAGIIKFRRLNCTAYGTRYV